MTFNNLADEVTSFRRAIDLMTALRANTLPVMHVTIGTKEAVATPRNEVIPYDEGDQAMLREMMARKKLDPKKEEKTYKRKGFHV